MTDLNSEINSRIEMEDTKLIFVEKFYIQSTNLNIGIDENFRLISILFQIPEIFIFDLNEELQDVMWK